MATTAGRLKVRALPRRLIVVGLALISAAAVAALYSRLSPNGRAWAHYQAGAEISCHGQYDPEAVRHLQTALRLNPRLFEARRSLATIYANMGKQKEAEGLFEVAIRLDRSDPRPYRELADLAMPDHPLQAARHLEPYLSLQPDDRHAWYLLAQCREKSGQWAETVRVWEQIAHRFPNDPRVNRALPRVRAKMKQAATQ